MPTERDPAPEKKPDRAPETPRTDLPPEREPYFGTDEEEGVVREEEEDSGDAGRRAAEESAGGEREIS